ncbi:hypothetical protein B0O99DRAFT_531356, partial [Bisporella sp. PMI_857]
SVTENQANLFTFANNTKSTLFNTKSVIKYYTSKRVDTKKIVLSILLYSRFFQNTNSFKNIYDIKVLLLAESITYYNENTASSYSYNNNIKKLVNYNTVEVAKQKAD